MNKYENGLIIHTHIHHLFIWDDMQTHLQ